MIDSAKITLIASHGANVRQNTVTNAHHGRSTPNTTSRSESFSSNSRTIQPARIASTAANIICTGIETKLRHIWFDRMTPSEI